MSRPFLWIDIGWTLVYTSSEAPGAGVPGPGEFLRRQLGLPPSDREQLDRIVFEKNLRTPQALTKALTEELARHGPLRESPQKRIVGLEACVQNFWRYQKKAPEPAAGAEAFLCWLRSQGWAYGLLSNITPPYWEGVVALFGRLVTEVPRVLSFEQGQSKPHPAFFHRAEALTGRSGAELAIIGDDMKKDIMPALGRGWSAVHVTSLRARGVQAAPGIPGAPVPAAGSDSAPPLSPLQVAERAVAFPAEGAARYRICPDLEALSACLSSFFDPSCAPVKLRGRGPSLPVIASVECLSSEWVCETLRQVPLVGTPAEHPYAHAKIEWDVAQKRAELYYAQLYLLKPQLEVIQSLASQLWKILARNPFRLDYGLCLILRFAQDEAVQFCYWFPPILEEAFLPDGRPVLLVADGMHRVFLSSSYDSSHLSAIRVTNLDPAFPYYAYPQARDWDKLVLLDAKPPPSARKNYREGANPKRLFRNYNALFPELQPPRR